MSKIQREAFVEGWFARSNGGINAEKRYPDSPLGNVREIVVDYLKREGYDGIFNERWKCSCKLDYLKSDMRCLHTLSCRPGVLVDGQIEVKEEK